MPKQPTQTRVRRKEKKNVTNAVAHVNSCLLYTSDAADD